MILYEAVTVVVPSAFFALKEQTTSDWRRSDRPFTVKTPPEKECEKSPLLMSVPSTHACVAPVIVIASEYSVSTITFWVAAIVVTKTGLGIISYQRISNQLPVCQFPVSSFQFPEKKRGLFVLLVTGNWKLVTVTLATGHWPLQTPSLQFS